MKLFVKLVFYCNFLFWGGGVTTQVSFPEN